MPEVSLPGSLTVAHRGRHSADDLIAAQLAAGKTVRDAAATAGVSEKTAHRRVGDPEFRKMVSGVRAGLIGSTAGILADGMTEAAGALRALLADTDPNVRHRAAVKLIELGLRTSELVDLEARVSELELALEDVGESR